MFLNEKQRWTLLYIARQSIHYSVQTDQPLAVDLRRYEAELQENCATFVTLKKQGDLRGCIGTLEAYQPLVKDVAEHAYAAAFSDPRFPALAVEELAQVTISISVLTSAEPLQFTNEENLLEKIQPGVDGLILEEGACKGTFLPSVWESLPDKQNFLQQLKLKAHLPVDYWSEQIKVSRYQTLEFAEA